MALNGSQQDRFLNLFTDNVVLEFQQRGSRLSNLFKKEMVKGQKTYFDKLGALGAARQKTSRHQAVVIDDETYERRLLTFETLSKAHVMDINDLMDMVTDPSSDVLRSIAHTLGREADRIIMNAISGNAVVQTDGSTANVAIPAAQKIGVSDITFDLDLSAGDKGLTPGKLMKAQKLLKQNYVTGEMVVIAPAGQLANILAHARASSGDYVSARPLESAGFEEALSGYLGLNFISYEETGVDANSDELSFVVSRDALKIGERQAMRVMIDKRPDLVATPDQIQGILDMGAVRMYEEAVVQIACDPRKA